MGVWATLAPSLERDVSVELLAHGCIQVQSILCVKLGQNKVDSRKRCRSELREVKDLRRHWSSYNNNDDTAAGGRGVV